MLDEFFFKRVYCPLGSFLNRVTGKSTVSIGWFFIIASEVLLAASAAVRHSWFAFAFDLLFLTWLFYWPRKVLRNIERSVEDKSEIPRDYLFIVMLRGLYNSFIVPVFLVIDLVTFSGFSSTLPTVMYAAGWNIASMLWPKRKSWAREKIENRNRSQVLVPALVRV